MAVVSSKHWQLNLHPSFHRPGFNHPTKLSKTTTCFPSSSSSSSLTHRRSISLVSCTQKDQTPTVLEDEEVKDLGVKAALSMLKFYKREISPILPNSCRYVPTCSEYSMEAYKRYGVAKGTILTAWRLCRCNPLGGSGFDPPRWFGEENPPQQ